MAVTISAASVVTMTRAVTLPRSDPRRRWNALMNPSRWAPGSRPRLRVRRAAGGRSDHDDRTAHRESPARQRVARRGFASAPGPCVDSTAHQQQVRFEAITHLAKGKEPGFTGSPGSGDRPATLNDPDEHDGD